MKLKRFVILMLMFFVCLSAAGTSPKATVCAASKAAAAKKLYKKKLNKKTFSYSENGKKQTVEAKSFRLLDIDRNGVPELIIKDGEANSTFTIRCIYTVQKGKLKYCGNFYQRGDARLGYSRKYKSLYRYWWTNGVGGTGCQYSQLKKGKLKDYKYFYTYQDDINGKNVYEYGKNWESRKNTDEKTFSSLSKKYSKDLKFYDFYENTPSNVQEQCR